MTVRQVIVGVLIGASAVCFAVNRLQKSTTPIDSPIPPEPTIASRQASERRVALVRRRPSQKKHSKTVETQLSSRKLY